MERKILNLIKKSSNVLIVTHVNPDGDTLGSASALKCFLDDINIKSDILIQIKDNFNFPNTYSFLPHINSSKNLSNLKDEYDLVIAIDIASIDRIVDNARKIFENAENTIAIDHHKTNKGYAKINYIEGGISSAGEVLCKLFKKLDIPITKEMATGLYAAILTDTGCFKYESTTSETFEIAAMLSKTGIDTSKIADLCYTNKPRNFILFQNEAVLNAKFCLNNKVVYTEISKELQEKYKAKDEYTEGIAETLRSIAGVEVAFVLKEKDGIVKVSIRTKEKDATIVTSKFNGGGHKRAAGCSIKEKLPVAAELLLSEIKKII